MFSRLGNGSPKKLRPSFQENGADDALPYQGVLKQSRLSDRVQPFTRPTNATTFAAKASTSLAVGRISVKDRLGSVSSDEIPPNYQSAGVLAGGQVPKSGKHQIFAHNPLRFASSSKGRKPFASYINTWLYCIRLSRECPVFELRWRRSDSLPVHPTTPVELGPSVLTTRKTFHATIIWLC